MNLLDVTFKDLLQSARSLSALMFMFVVPILITVLFFFMFGGMGSDEGFQVPRTTVVIANQDQGTLPEGMGVAPSLPGDLGFDPSGITSMGDVLAGLLQGELFDDLLQASAAPSPEKARAFVDSQQAAVAVVIPADFTAVLIGADATTAVEVYRDPTLTLGPMIVEAIVRQMVDRFGAGTIGTRVVLDQATNAGIPVTPELVQEVVTQLTAAALTQDSQQEGAAALIEIQEPPGVNAGADFLSDLLGVILGGMMTFFAFFTAAGTIESILVEEEKGTLQRLFTTPVPRRAILSGKALASIVTLMVQVTVLMTFGVLVFSIDWGRPAVAVLAAAGMIILAAATGLFLVSFLQNTRQGGVIFGGVLTLTGMLGMIPVFTGGVTASPLVDAVSLIVPQGWAIRGLLIAQEGGTIVDLAPTLLVILLWTAAFSAVGLRRLQRRFA